MNFLRKSLLALSFLPSALFAQKSRPVVEIVPFAQYSLIDGTFNAKNRGSVGAEFGVFAGRNLELQVSATPGYFQKAPDFTPVDAHLVWNFPSLLGSTTFRPLLGVGGVREKIGSTTVDGASALAGVRVGFLKAEAIANFLPDIHRVDLDNRVNYSGRLGVSIPLGKRRETPVKPVVINREVVKTVVVTKRDTVTIVRTDTVTVKGAQPQVKIPYRKDKP